MKKTRLAAGLLALVSLFGGLLTAAPAQATQVTVTVWVPWGTGSDYYNMWNAAAARIEAKNANINVVVQGDKDMAVSLAAINAGNGPDISIANGVGNVGWFCGTGAWKNLNVLIAGSNGINLTKTFTKASIAGTYSRGVRCALPFSSEIFGFYYNKTLLKSVGWTKPPTTTTELKTLSKKLTKFDSAGNIVRAGYIPWAGAADNDMGSLFLGAMFGAQFFDPMGGTSYFYKDKRWEKAFRWQKSFIADVYGGGDFNKGSRRIKKFFATAGGFWGANNDFVTGRLAMLSHADWMASMFCSGDDWTLNPCTTPLVNMGVAGFPVDPSIKKTNYGAGIVGANTMGISRGSAHVNEAWTVMKGLATDKTLSLSWSNMTGDPSSLLAARGKANGAVYPAFYQGFYDISAHPKSGYHVLANTGEHLEESGLQDLMSAWQAGSQTNITKGLQELAAHVNQILKRNNN